MLLLFFLRFRKHDFSWKYGIVTGGQHGRAVYNHKLVFHSISFLKLLIGISFHLFSVILPDLYLSRIIFEYTLNDGFYNVPVTASKSTSHSLRERGCLVPSPHR